MMGAKFLWTTTVTILVCTTLANIKTTSLSELLQNVPDTDKLDFLRYHVNHGYMLATSENAYKFQNGYSDEFSVELYQYFMENRLITDEIVLQRALNQVCFPNGACIDIDDPGIHPRK